MPSDKTIFVSITHVMNLFIYNTVLWSMSLQCSRHRRGCNDLILIFQYLTHWPLGDLNVILKIGFSILFYWLVSSDLLMIVPLLWMPQDLTDDRSTLFQIMAWDRQATSHYLGQCWLSSLSPYDVARAQWVNLLKPSGAYMRYLTGSPLVLVTVCLLLSDKPLPELMLTSCHFCLCKQTVVQFD